MDDVPDYEAAVNTTAQNNNENSNNNIEMDEAATTDANPSSSGSNIENGENIENEEDQQQSSKRMNVESSAPAKQPAKPIPGTLSSPETRIRILFCVIGDTDDHILLKPNELLLQQVLGLSNAFQKDIQDGYLSSITESLILAVKTYPQKTELYATLFANLHFLDIKHPSEDESMEQSLSISALILRGLLRDMTESFIDCTNFIRTKLTFRFLCVCAKLKAISAKSMLEFINNLANQQDQAFILLIVSSYPWIASIVADETDVDHEENKKLLKNIEIALEEFSGIIYSSGNSYNRLRMGIEYSKSFKSKIDEGEYFKRREPYTTLMDSFKSKAATVPSLEITISASDFPAIQKLCYTKRVHLPFSIMHVFSNKNNNNINNANQDQSSTSYKSAEWFLRREMITEYIQLYAPSWRQVAQILERLLLKSEDNTLARIVLEELITCFLASPQSLHGSVYYERILSYLCGSSPLANIFPQLVDEVLDDSENSFYDDPDHFNRISRWIAYHIHLIGVENWLWEAWAVLEKTSKKSLLIHRVLEYLDQLSYPDTLQDDIPGDLAIPVTPSPSLAYFPEPNTELSMHQERAKALFDLIRSRPDPNDLLNFLRLDEIILKSFTLQEKVDFVTHTILRAGKASLSHLVTSIERNSCLFIELGCNENEENKLMLLDSIQGYWDAKKASQLNLSRQVYQLYCSPTELSCVLSKLIELNIMDAKDVTKWWLKVERAGKPSDMINDIPLPTLWCSQDWYWRMLSEEIFGKHFSKIEQIKYKIAKITTGLENEILVKELDVNVEIGKRMIEELDASLTPFSTKSPHKKWHNVVSRLYRPLIE